MSYINIQTLEYPVSEDQIRRLYPHMSFGKPFSPPEGFAWVNDVVKPNFEDSLQKLVELSPVSKGDGFYQRWSVVNLPSQLLRERQESATEVWAKGLMDSLEAFYNSTAHERGYDSKTTCAMRAGYAGPFQEEATRFAIWMDETTVKAFQHIEAVKLGTEKPKGFLEFVASTGKFTW